MTIPGGFPTGSDTAAAQGTDDTVHAAVVSAIRKATTSINRAPKPDAFEADRADLARQVAEQLAAPGGSAVLTATVEVGDLADPDARRRLGVAIQNLHDQRYGD